MLHSIQSSAMLFAALEEDERFVLEVDLGAFRRNLPRMKRVSTIGQGVDFLNRHLSSSLSRDTANGGINGSLFSFLKTLTYAGELLPVSLPLSPSTTNLQA